MKRKFVTAVTFFLVGTLFWAISGFYGCIFLPGVLVRGGLLYDKWWKVSGVLDSTEPMGDHPLYPDVGEKSGSTTWRCKECHGWDYMGIDGAYGSGSHYTGIKGIYDSGRKTVIELTNLLKTGEHDFSAHLSDQDIADIAAFITNGLIDMTLYIDLSTKEANGDEINGETLYSGSGQCVYCHGADGKDIDLDGKGVGDVARDNPWETLHKIRFGHPGSSMPSAIENGLSTDDQVDILTHCQTL
jgi:mono/diheme cytochrome c family protein